MIDMYYIKGEPARAAQIREKILTEFQDLSFQEEGHIYTLNGKVIETTVSGVGHRFESRPFDEASQAVRYAQKHGETPEYWIEKWHANSLRATTLGTKTHEFGESLAYVLNGMPERIVESAKGQYDAEKNTLIPGHVKEGAVCRFLDEMQKSNLHLILNEAKVYSGKNPDPSKNIKELICGTFDMLYYDEERDGVVLLDYKTNSNLYSEYNRKWNVHLLKPFQDFYEEALGMYTIQLSLYALMLEDIGLKVLNRFLIWLKDDGTYQTVAVPDVSDRLRKVL